MARFEVRAVPGMTDTPTDRLDLTHSVTKVSDTQVAALLMSDDGSVDMRMIVDNDGTAKLIIWVCPGRAQGQANINREIYAGSVKEFCRGMKELIEARALKMLEEHCDTSD